MAAIDIPWISYLGTPMSSRDDAAPGASSSTYDPQSPLGSAPPTYASFSPVTLSANTPSRNSRRSTVLVHQKSPLLLATPPQITRALAYSHPFLLPLNTFVGLLTWSTGDPWQSFLLLTAFWAVVLYGDVVLLRAGPVVLGAGFIAGMYGRRYSSLSSSVFTNDAVTTRHMTGSGSGHSDEEATEWQPKHGRAKSELMTSTPTTTNGTANANPKPKTKAKGNPKHQKTLDEIVDTLREFTGRCNMLMDPLLEMTDFLSTQRTPTSATTKPALTAMFVRLLILTPFWIALTMSPWRIITTRRVVLVTGSIILTWHSRVMRVTRAIMWRSATVRRLAAAITGLTFDGPPKPAATTMTTTMMTTTTTTTMDGAAAPWEKSAVGRQESRHNKALSVGQASLHLSHRRNKGASVKFTFIIYENQRRWVGLGWTASLFAYERPAWTDEHQNGVPPRDEFELPEVEDGSRMRWRWAEGSRWRVDGVADEEGLDYDGLEGKNGWIYYDNKWQNGKRGSDGWGRWTRRRKWYRDAELVEMDDMPPALELDATDTVPGPHTESYSTANEKMRVEPLLPRPEVSVTEDDSADGERSKAGHDAGSVSPVSSRFWPILMRRTTTDRGGGGSNSSNSYSNSYSNSSISNSRIGKKPGSVTSNEEDDDRKRNHDDEYKRTISKKKSSTTDDETSGLGLRMELELQKQDKDGGQWGIGDEARMSLE